MHFQTILHTVEEAQGEPAFFQDLHLDQIFSAAIQNKGEYDLAPIYRAPLHSEEAVRYRQQVFRDLQLRPIMEALQEFAQSMRAVQSTLNLVGGLSNPHQIALWRLHAMHRYGDAAVALSDELKAARSPGLQSFRGYLKEYVESATFRATQMPAKALLDEVAAIRYMVVMIGLHVEVRPYDEEADYSKEIAVTFDRFQQGESIRFPFDSRDSLDMNHVELRILDGVAHLNEDLFARIARHAQQHLEFLDPALVRFDREIQFYVSYLEHLQGLGIEFCYPVVSASEKSVVAKGACDLALAAKLAQEQSAPVLNDFELTGRERMIVVSGPNQGGKTTFARMFGQLHYLAALGCPVPATEAKLFLPDGIYTHFERQEQMTNLRGKLEDDVVRIHAILEQATTASIILVNEIFASTSLRDALFLSQQVAGAIHDLDGLCVWVTFIEELAAAPDAVSYVSQVDPGNPAVRTLKVIKRAADGLAYAMSIAEKYRLTFESVKERISP